MELDNNQYAYMSSLSDIEVKSPAFTNPAIKLYFLNFNTSFYI